LLEAPRRARLIDWAIASALFGFTLSLLALTLDVGFPRDEGFYFRFSSAYQSWFYDVEGELAEPGPNPSLAREKVSTVWRGNAEHPPLAKVLFGYSWRMFGRHQRPVLSVEERSGEQLISIGSARVTEGFHIGAEVRILAPRPLDAAPGSERELGRAVVLDAGDKRVTASLRSGELTQAAFGALCAQPVGPDQVPGTYGGCTALPVNRGLVAESTGFRLPALLWSALLVASIYGFGCTLVGRFAALFAALAFLFVPRHFFHMHMTAFDVPVAAMIFFSVAAFWRALDTTSRRENIFWTLCCGVVWGLAALTKHNAWFVPLVSGMWWLAGVRFRPLRVPRMPMAFLAMTFIGIPMFVLLWPRLWFDGWENFRWYVAFHTDHDHYMQMYFGNVLAYPPFPVLFPFALTAMTLPLSTLGALAAGVAVFLRGPLARLISRVRRSASPTAPTTETSPLWAPPARPGFSAPALLWIHGLWPIVLIALPNTPVFGGVKHWLPAMPFLLLIAGVGLSKAVSSLVATLRFTTPWRSAMACLVLLIVLAPSARATLHAHPNGTAYWNELTGGAPGAARLGMQRQFWGYPTRLALDFLNRHARKDSLIYFHKSVRDAWELYRKEGLLRWDIRHVADIFDFGKIERRLQDCEFAVYHHQKDHDEYELAIWRAYQTHLPVWQASYDGIPIVSVYRNPSPPAPKPQK
jgi:hypothetical protein